MHRLRLICLLAVLPLSAAAAQTRTPSFEASFGVARRSPNQQDLSEDGLQGAVRVGVPLTPRLRVLSAITWTAFADKELITPSFCPGPLAQCSIAPRKISGVGVAALTTGLEAIVPVIGLELRPSAMVGGGWLYHHADGVPSQALGVDAGIALALPIGARERVLLEGRWVHLTGAAGSAANSRRVSVGFALR